MDCAVSLTSGGRYDFDAFSDEACPERPLHEMVGRHIDTEMGRWRYFCNGRRVAAIEYPEKLIYVGRDDDKLCRPYNLEVGTKVQSTCLTLCRVVNEDMIGSDQRN